MNKPSLAKLQYQMSEQSHRLVPAGVEVAALELAEAERDLGLLTTDHTDGTDQTSSTIRGIREIRGYSGPT